VLENPDLYHMLNGLKVRQQVFTRCGFYIYQVVGNIIAAFVDHVDNIDVPVGQDGQDLTKHAGNILVDDCQACTRAALQGNVRKIHRVGDIAVFQKIPQLVHRHDGAVV